MQPADWPSLVPQANLADRLFGPRGMKLLDAWLTAQARRIDDPDFARLFSDHIDLPRVRQGDYNHRLVRSSQGKLLGGIRFYDRDLARPFVEIVAHDFVDLAALRDCVAAEWSIFSPRDLRMLVLPGTVLPLDAVVDMTLFAARYAEMPRPDGRVELVPFEPIEDAIALVSARYEALSSAQPALALNLSASDPDDVQRWHVRDEMRAITIELDGARKTVGLLAAAPGAVERIEGDEINEEVVAKEYNGRGFAASAQKAWAVRADLDPARLFIGTIDARNIASRKSAIQAGRPAVLDYVFFPLVRDC